jgi:hypothetical protein
MGPIRFRSHTVATRKAERTKPSGSPPPKVPIIMSKFLSRPLRASSPSPSRPPPRSSRRRPWPLRPA